LASLAVASPASWFDLDLDTATRRESIARAVERTADRLDALGRDKLARMLEGLAAEAQAQGALFAALYSDVLEERPVSASLVVSIRQGEGGSAPPGMTREGLAQGLSQVLSRSGEVDVRDLAAGPAVRVRTRIQAPIPGQETEVEVENVQWFVPFPDGSALALLAFSTPSLGLAEPFGKLFDAIAGTLRWT
jgi:hypothetical protein